MLDFVPNERQPPRHRHEQKASQRQRVLAAQQPHRCGRGCPAPCADAARPDYCRSAMHACSLLAVLVPPLLLAMLGESFQVHFPVVGSLGAAIGAMWP
eukprot:scaffold396_cov339-Prasinococcus_capsulatus_cf.AAC.13